MNFMGTIDCFSVQHFLVMFVIILFLVIGLIYVKKNIKKRKNINRLLIVLSVFLIVIWIACRISFVYHSIEEKDIIDFFGFKRGYNWWCILPNSFCSFIGLIVPFIIFFNKYKNNKFLEAVYSMAILGLLTNTIYPEYIARYPFYQFQTVGAIIYHVICGFIIIVLLMTKDLKPKLKNWYYTPIAISLMISFGIFELVYLGFPESFNISRPLVPGVFATTVGFLCIGYVVIDVLLRLILEKLQSK